MFRLFMMLLMYSIHRSCELDEELALNIHYKPAPLRSHLKNYVPPPPITRSLSITQQIEDMSKNNNLKMWKDICKGY